MKSYRANQLQPGMRLVRYRDAEADQWVDTDLTIKHVLSDLGVPTLVRVELDDGETVTLPSTTEFEVDLGT